MRTDDHHAIESGATSFYVPKGYIHVIAQGRGAGLSQRQWRWFDEKERTDGYDLIEWIAAQPWCTGKVGMNGVSYFSMVAKRVAALKPPHLAAIFSPYGFTDGYRDVLYRGGILARNVAACASCHGPAGAGVPAQYPRVAGQFAEYSLAQLQAFRLGERANDPNKMMRAVAAKLSDVEIKAVAEYIAGLR